MATEKLSPGMQQYVDIKKQYPDAFLLFRMGDFYELFYEQLLVPIPYWLFVETSTLPNSWKIVC